MKSLACFPQEIFPITDPHSSTDRYHIQFVWYMGVIHSKLESKIFFCLTENWVMTIFTSSISHQRYLSPPDHWPVCLIAWLLAKWFPQLFGMFGLAKLAKLTGLIWTRRSSSKALGSLQQTVYQTWTRTGFTKPFTRRLIIQYTL